MRLPFLSSPDPDAPAGEDAVAAARTLARRRLVGALVLLLAGVVVFPLLFESQPRPLSPDTPIVTARDAGSAARLPAPEPEPTRTPPPDAGVEARADARAAGAATPARPASAPGAAAAAVAAAPVAAGPAAAPRPLSAPSAPAGTAASAPVPVAVARSATPAAAAAPAAAPAPVKTAPVALKPPQAAAPAPASTPMASPPPVPASAAAASRFVVQVGAFTDAATLRETRARVEKLGLKTYTQVIEGDAGRRTRVRVGPFATREEANAVAGRLKAAGLPGSVLAL